MVPSAHQQHGASLHPAPNTAPRRAPWIALAIVVVAATGLNLGLLAWDDNEPAKVEDMDERRPGAAVGTPVDSVARAKEVEGPSRPRADDVVASAARATNPTPRATEIEQPLASPDVGSQAEQTTPDNQTSDEPDAELQEQTEDPVPSKAPGPAPAEPPTPPVAVTPQPEPEPEPKQKPKPRVMALFFLKGATQGEIRLAGRTTPVDTVATLNLRPGHYVTNWRRKGETEWRNAGRVKIPGLDPTAQYCEIRLEGDSYRSITRAIPKKKGAR